MKNNSKSEYEQLQQQKMREQAVLESMQKSNIEYSRYEYSEEQMLAAQEQLAKKNINKLYSDKVFPTNNLVLYFVYYVFSLIIIPLLYVNENEYKVWVGVGAWGLLIVIFVVIKYTEKLYQKDMRKQYKSMEYLNDFSNDTSVFCCLLTSFGYFAEFLGIFEFVCIYSAMLVVFLIAFYYRIIKPLYYDMKGRKGN